MYFNSALIGKVEKEGWNDASENISLEPLHHVS